MCGLPKPRICRAAVAPAFDKNISAWKMCTWYLALPCAIVALALGGVAVSKAKRGEAGGKSMATAGVVCAIISVALDIIIAATVGAFIASMFHGR